MAIDLDIDSITSVGDLSSAISSTLTSQISSFTGQVSGSLGSFLLGSGEACDLFGAAIGMARNCTEDFKSGFKEMSKGIMGAFSNFSSVAGSMLRSVTATVGMLKQKLADVSSWLLSQGESILSSAKSIINSIKSVINSSFSAVASAISSCTSFISGLKDKMFDAVSFLPPKSCAGISGALKSIGSGAGLGSIVDTLTELDPGKFAEKALSGLTGSMQGMASSVMGIIGDIPNPASTNSQLSSIMSNIDSLMGA